MGTLTVASFWTRYEDVYKYLMTATTIAVACHQNKLLQPAAAASSSSVALHHTRTQQPVCRTVL